MKKYAKILIWVVTVMVICFGAIFGEIKLWQDLKMNRVFVPWKFCSETLHVWMPARTRVVHEIPRNVINSSAIIDRAIFEALMPVMTDIQTDADFIRVRHLGTVRNASFIHVDYINYQVKGCPRVTDMTPAITLWANGHLIINRPAANWYESIFARIWILGIFLLANFLGACFLAIISFPIKEYYPFGHNPRDNHSHEQPLCFGLGRDGDTVFGSGCGRANRHGPCFRPP